VLPFVNRSTDPEQQYLADGLSEELMNRLAQIEGWLVIARTSSFAFKGRDGDVREIGKALGVAFILEGSVRQSGKRLRIIAQLVDTADGHQLWSRTYDRGLGDVLAIQEDIAGSVAQTLSATLGIGADDGLFGLGTQNAEAYDKSLRARGLLSAGGAENTLRAEQLFREAIAIDPDFLGARGMLGRVLDTVRFYVPERAAEAARELDAINDGLIAAVPEHPASHIVRGVQAWHRNDWLGAERALAKARETAPPGELLREAERLTSLLQRNTGRFAEALPYLRASVRADPLSLERSFALQQGLHATAHLEDAEEEYVRSRDLLGDRALIEYSALLRAVVEGYPRPRVEERLARMKEIAPQPPGGIPIAALLDHDRATALEALRSEFDRLPGHDAMPALLIAFWADYHGDTALALTALRRWLAQTSRFDAIVWTPFLDSTRHEPGFKDIVREYALLDYWREAGQWGDYCRPVGSGDFECR
jgi:TolB-like protein/tetratricopeptide (TPR) repeat protein